jgi:hypothetical protein
MTNYLDLEKNILTRSATPSPVFKDGVRKRGSGATLSKPWPSGRGVEGLTSGIHLIFACLPVGRDFGV